MNNLKHDFSTSGGRFSFLRKAKKSGTIRAVDDVSLNIREGETYALVGESGSGKSTIARIIAGLLSAQDGQIRIDGTTKRSTHGAVQMVFQDPYASLNPRWRIGDIIAEPIRRLNLEKDNQAIQNRVHDLLKRCD
ncbi:ATP-binding cassette domain-containing protein [Brucella pituitosa]|uniref:ATP-binding cassette domain-containing protein n=1 Tax=Brucella pituitosa TaxID=571256 RepID=UPI0020921AEC|nr:ATP-binding cassette domain-containing protein [Brucella pituitosa]